VCVCVYVCVCVCMCVYVCAVQCVPPEGRCFYAVLRTNKSSLTLRMYQYRSLAAAMRSAKPKICLADQVVRKNASGGGGRWLSEMTSYNYVHLPDCSNSILLSHAASQQDIL